MQFLDALPVGVLALLIFFMRIADVSLGTIRTISVVNGRGGLSMLFGFFEITIWIVAVSQVMVGVRESPVLVLAYAGGYSAGTGVGVLLERRLALGWCVVRIISIAHSSEIIGALRALGQRLTTFQGLGRNGPRTLLYATCRRRDLRRLVVVARALDPDLFYTVEPVSLTSSPAPIHHQPTGWRAVLKKK